MLDSLGAAMRHARAYDALPPKNEHFTGTFIRKATSYHAESTKNHPDTQVDTVRRTVRDWASFKAYLDDSAFTEILEG